jgi:hypothetical protein
MNNAQASPVRVRTQPCAYERLTLADLAVCFMRYLIQLANIEHESTFQRIRYVGVRLNCASQVIIRITMTILDTIHRPAFYLKLISLGLSVPHRKHITSPLRAQQVNAIYAFVTMVY